MKVRSSWIVVSVLALVAVGLGAVSIKTDGTIETDGQFVSNELTLPPLQVSSSAMVTGLNAEFLGDLDSNAFAGAGHIRNEHYTKTEADTTFAPLGHIHTPADGPCFANLNRYVNCGNGTETDTVTGLIWLKDANCLDLFGGISIDWASANNAAALLADGQCGLSDGSSPGDWRLPTRAEWAATVAQAVVLGCTSSGANDPPSLTDRAGTGCLFSDPSPAFSGVQFLYWSSSAAAHAPVAAWGVGLTIGSTSTGGDKFENVSFFVWPVRGGQ